MLSLRAVAELAMLLTWAVGGFFAVSAALPRQADAANAVHAERVSLLNDLNRFRVMEGVPALGYDARLASLVDRNLNLGLVGRRLVEEQSAVCQAADWVTLIGSHQVTLFDVLRSPTATYSSGTLLNTLYTHVAIASSPGATETSVVYRFLLCRAQQ